MNIPHWWQNGVIYQVYPKSFQDTTGSGTGDLRGVTQHLGYLQTLGVDAIWLTPFYISPQVDNGYDVADYMSVDPAYGTLADFDELVAQAKARGIRIILDMVFNHTSTQHPGFARRWIKTARIVSFTSGATARQTVSRITGAPNLAAAPGAGTPKASSTICTSLLRSRQT